ncbi:hypothetical protein GC174_18185 [bacterium]|nr:hypothetical protein [bacterium]
MAKDSSSVRIDALLLSKYGIISPTRANDALVVIGRLEDLTLEDRRDLVEFASFVVGEHRRDLDLLLDEGVIQDEA